MNKGTLQPSKSFKTTLDIMKKKVKDLFKTKQRFNRQLHGKYR